MPTLHNQPVIFCLSIPIRQASFKSTQFGGGAVPSLPPPTPGPHLGCPREDRHLLTDRGEQRDETQQMLEVCSSKTPPAAGLAGMLGSEALMFWRTPGESLPGEGDTWTVQ